MCYGFNTLTQMMTKRKNQNKSSSGVKKPKKITSSFNPNSENHLNEHLNISLLQGIVRSVLSFKFMAELHFLKLENKNGYSGRQVSRSLLVKQSCNVREKSQLVVLIWNSNLRKKSYMIYVLVLPKRISNSALVLCLVGWEWSDFNG